MIARREARNLYLVTDETERPGNGEPNLRVLPPAETDPTMVAFCGEEFCAEALMELEVDRSRPTDFGEFCELVKQLDAKAKEAQGLGKTQSEPVFFNAAGKSDYFLRALDKIGHKTNWQILKFNPRPKTGNDGYDLHVMLQF